MMGIDPERLTMRQYEAVLGEWNDRHSTDDQPPELDPERVRAAMSLH